MHKLFTTMPMNEMKQNYFLKNYHILNFLLAGVQLARQCPLLIHVHCYAHRLALAVSQSAKEIVPLKKYQETVTAIFNYYTNSPVR